MKLVTIDVPGGSEAGAVIGDEIVHLRALEDMSPVLPRWAPKSAAEIVETGVDGLALVEWAVKTFEDADDGLKDVLRDGGSLRPMADTPLLSPFPRPPQIVSTGGNYHGHLREVEAHTGLTIGTPKVPVGFLKNSNAVVGPNAPIILPAHKPDEVDYEAEFCFVIGKPCHNIKADEAMDVIAGYTMANDVSHRGWNKEAERADGSLDFTLPTLGKQFPSFCPLGPTFATPDEIPNPADTNFGLKLNGEVMQDGNTSDMIFNFGQILEYFSQWHSFVPGDVVTTGSPAGVGFARNPPQFLKAGDEITLWADGIGSMTNPVIMGGS